MSKFCTKCGAQIAPDSLFCGKCGTRLVNEPEEVKTPPVAKESFVSDDTNKTQYSTQPKAPANKKKLIGICGAVAALLLVLIVVLVMPKGTSNPNGNKGDDIALVIGNDSSVITLTLSEYVDEYNSVLRRTVSSSTNTNVSDSDYISCAKTLINKALKNPSTAQYNSASVYEKDSYGRAIVYLDVSAQNSFGGWVRSEYYVCIQSYKSDGTFTYSSSVPYVDEKSSYNILVMMNDFGEDPADEELEGLLFEYADYVRTGETIVVTPTQSLECYKLSFDYGTQYVYVDSSTNKVISVKTTFKNTSGNFEKCEKICAASIAALTDTSMSSAKANAANVINLSNFTPTSNSVYFNDGFVYDYGAGISVTLADEDNFKGGLYWTPNNGEEYYEKLADEYSANKDFDNAIIFYEQAQIKGEKINAAYYGKAEQSLDVGNLDEAGLYFNLAGNYKDAAVRVLEVFYTAGQQHEKNNDFNSAIYSYSMAGDYSDAKAKCKECNFKQGEINMSDKKYLEAATCFEGAADYSGASEKYKEACYLYAEQQLLTGSTDTASAYFKKAGDYKDASTRMLKYHYDKGTEQLASKDYLSAADSFKQIMDYSDASEKYKEANYLYGEQLLDKGQIETAKTYFYNAKGYSDADTRIQRYYYEAGEALLKSTDYLEAAEKFILAGNYSDSTTKEKECYYEYGKAQLSLGYTTSGISYMEKCRGFKDADEYVLSHYFKEAETLFNSYMTKAKSFDWGYEPTYETVRSSLERCEGYSNSGKMISVLDVVHGLWLSADKSFSMITNGKPALATYTYHMEGFTATYTDSTITLYEKALQNAYNNSNEATIVTDYNKSYFKATVKNIFERSPWGGDSTDITRCIIAMFTGNYDDVDLKNHLNGKSWVEISGGYKTEIKYGGYNIVITSSHENYGYTDLIIEASK